MADDNTQNSQTDPAQVPDWLKKAQDLANHEQNVSPVQAATATAVLPEVKPEPAAVLPNQEVSPQPQLQPESSKVEPVKVDGDLSIVPPKELKAGEIVDAPLPDWIKKAADNASQKAAEGSGQNVILPQTVQGSQGLVVQPTVESVVPPKPTSVPANPATSNLAAPTEPVKQSEEKKKRNSLFEQAKNSFLSFLSKGKTTLEKSQTAGVKTAVGQSGAAQNSVTNSPKDGKGSQEKVTQEEQKQVLEAEKIYQQGLTTIRDLIAPSSMEIRYDLIRVEGMYAQTFFVYAYPRYLDTNWLSPIVNFDVTMDISQFIYPIESATIMRVLKKKVAQMQASVRINAEKGMVSDPALDTALQDAEELRTQIQRGQEKFFQFALYFTIYSEDDKKLQKTAKQLESILGAKLILTKKAELQSEHGFNACLPLCIDELEVTRNMNTSPLSATFPFSSSDLTSNEGILYGLNRHNDSLIIFDRFSLENANSVVFAKSGAGKSYAVKLEILRAMMLGTDVIVIDPENEYQDLTQTVGGSYLRVSLTADRRINPFDLPASIMEEEVQPGDLLRNNIISLHGLLKIMLGGVTPEEEGILDKALNDVYALKGITMDLVDPSKIPPPTMEDLYDILSSMEGATSLAQRLQKYTSGTYAGIFNKPTNVDLGTGLMVFSIRDLEDALRPIAMYIILNYIWNRVRSKLKKRILVIDEAWTMMQHEDSAKFLFGLVKRARKYYLGITTITQDVEDFVKGAYGKPVVTNSSMQLLLKQAPAAIDILGKMFNLTEGEKYMLLNSGVGQGLFFAGLKHVAIQIIASYTEDKIVTTNPEEILKAKTDNAANYES